MTLGLLCSALATSEQRLNLVLPAILGLQSLAATGTAIASVPSVPVLDQTEYSPAPRGATPPPLDGGAETSSTRSTARSLRSTIDKARPIRGVPSSTR